MLFSNPIAFKCIFILFVLVLAVVGYAFLVNYLRASDDPEKQDYHPLLFVLIPIQIILSPMLFALGFFMFILWAALLVGFLILFSISLVFFRKWFFLVWWHKFATKIGDPLLKFNNSLIRMAFRPWKEISQPM